MSTSQAWFKPRDLEQDIDITTEEIDAKGQEVAEGSVTPEAEELPSRRIHILGAGSIGLLVANALKQLPNSPPITLLIHRQEQWQTFKKVRKSVRLATKDRDVEDIQTGFDADVLSSDGVWEYNPYENEYKPVNEVTSAEKMESGENFIYTLIVTVKALGTVRALQSVKHRVGAATTVLFMQNGLGQIDELNKHVFTDPAKRPTYMLGIVSHGCYKSGDFRVVHAGAGTVALGIYRDQDKFPMPPKGVDLATQGLEDSLRRQYFPSNEDLYSNISSRYLLRTMTRCPTLACAPYPYLDLFQLQLEKLVSNCIINPFTALLNVKNGATLDNPHLTRVQRLLLTEIALVIQALPELEGIPNVRSRFEPARLELAVQTVSTQTAQNSSSMREDVRLLRETEIDYINGYIVKRGEEQGIKCVLNYMLMSLVKARSYILQGEDQLRRETYGRNEISAEIASDGSVTLEDVSGPPRTR